MITDESHYVALAAAYARGALLARAEWSPSAALPREDERSEDRAEENGSGLALGEGLERGENLDDASALAKAQAAGLELHRFKRSAQLPRVRAVIGALRGFAPESLVDLGSGRGVFVWPLLDALRELRVTAVDVLPHRAQLYEHVRRGGIDRVAGVRGDVTALPFADAAVDCVTALEVLEHLPGDAPARA